MRETPLRELLERYATRIPHYMPFEIIVIPDVKTSRALPAEQQKLREGQAIIAAINGSDYVVLFDERGRELTSNEFATFIDRKASTLSRNLVFVIGGPYGFSQEIYDRANMLMGLSKMTFTHEMARVLAVEQIYRAQTILRGEPYHHN